MNLYLDHPISAQIILFLLGVFLIWICHFIGRLLLSEGDVTYWNMANSILLGFLMISIVTAFSYTFLNSQLTPLFILIGLLYFFKKKNEIVIDKRKLLFLAVIFVLPFIYVCIVTVKHSQDSIIFMSKDYAFYAKLSYNLINSQIETNLVYDISTTNGHPIYHYIELWFNGGISHLFGTNYYLTFCFVYTPLIITTILLYLLGFIEALRLSWKLAILVMCIPILTSLPPFFSFIDLPWYLSFDFINKSIIHYCGVYPLVCFLLMSFTYFWLNRIYLALIIFSFTGLINPILIGVIPLCLLFFSIIHWFLQKRFSSFQEITFYNLFIPLLISIGVATYSILMSGMNVSYPQGEMGFPERSPEVELTVGLKLLISTVLYCSIYLYGFYLSLRYFPMQRTLNLFLGLFVFSCFAFFSYYYDIIAGDIIQLQFISWNIPVIIFGTVFLIQAIPYVLVKKQYFIVGLLVLNTFWGMLNTFGEKYSSLGGIFPWNNTGTSYNINDVKKLSILTQKIGYNGGYVIDIKDTNARNITQSDIIELSCFIPKINTLRLNTIINDETDLGCKRIIANTHFEKHHMKDEQNKNQILHVISQNHIDWLFVQDNRYIFPDFLENVFPNVYEFQKFTIYSK